MEKEDEVYPPNGVIFDLEEAIKIHIDNQRKRILPQHHSAINAVKELHIETIEKAPRDSASLQKAIETKRLEKDRARVIDDTQKIWTELDALEYLMALVRRFEAGKSLDGLAY